MNYKYIDQLAKCIKERYCEHTSDNYSLYADSLVNFLEMDKNKPLILSNEDYKNQNTIQLYRGYNTSDDRFQEHKRNFAVGQFQRRFLPGNVYGVGLYFSDEETTAKQYTDTYSKVISAKISEKAKIVSSEKMRDYIANFDKALRYQINLIFGDRLNQDDKEYFMQRMYSLTDVMFAAKLLNIDGITSDGHNYGTNYIIFNRSALVVNEEDFKDVINKSSTDCEPGENE